MRVNEYQTPSTNLADRVSWPALARAPEVVVPPVRARGQSEARSMVTRRPPVLRFRREAGPDRSGLRAITSDHVEEIASIETAEFAFSVSELAYRLEGPVTASGDPAAEDGLQALSHMARMYEHLVILQREAEM